jgi:hypothetical protein
MAGAAESSRGRKVIFLHPHSVIVDQLVQTVAALEYEAYLVKDHVGLKRVLALPDFQNALLFVNIDEELSERDWKDYVRGLRESPATSHVQIGILSYNVDAALSGAYLMEIGVQCGFVKLRVGVAESTRIVLATLVATEAKGQRKYVRASCTGILSVGFNAKVGGTVAGGRILDISSVGMACVFDTDPKLKPETALPDTQLKLKGSIAMVGATVAGTRQAGADRVYVVLFAQPLPEGVKERIYRFIRECLQAQMKRLLEGAVTPPA